MRIRPARTEDLGTVRCLLRSASLPDADVEELLPGFLVAVAEDDGVIGCVGLERSATAGLLRSLVVASDRRRQGIARALCDALETEAGALGVENLYLLTPTAETFFARRGYASKPREEAPPAIRETREFRELCPATAVFMHRRLERSATRSWRHFEAKDLPLVADASGARFWAVALDKAMLTYFEVPPGCRFETHRHESEQITLVLTGVLYFEVDGEERAVGPGEVLALASNVPHAVFTRDAPVTAVDAWSPVIPQYRA